MDTPFTPADVTFELLHVGLPCGSCPLADAARFFAAISQDSEALAAGK